jgi:catechol 2,3-dioxygenase-like lactoylglutathione lyase family enzyme
MVTEEGHEAHVYLPVADLKQALALYRDTLGWQEAWREGDTTTSLRLPGTEIELMIDTDDGSMTPGPVFEVDSVQAFWARHRDELRFRFEPKEIPRRFLVRLRGPVRQPHLRPRPVHRRGGRLAPAA